jgi:hypothetical protein
LLRDRRDGRHYATSATTPGKRYYVTLASCTCVGFQTHQRCKHWAALNVAMILQEGGPDPETFTTSAPCPTCDGLGSHPATIATGPTTWIYTSVACEACGGTGTVIPEPAAA